MGFETYLRGTKAPEESIISIGRNRSLYINPAAYKLLGQPDFIELLYDRQGRRIGLRRAKEDSLSKRRASHVYGSPGHPRTNSAIIGVGGLITEYGLHHIVGRRYRAVMEANTLVVDLKSESLPTGQSWRAKSKELPTSGNLTMFPLQKTGTD